MKKFGLVLSVFFLYTAAKAQIENPVTWSYSAKKIATGKYELHLTANISKGWHIYSQTTPDGGPFPTEVSFVKNPLVAITGDCKEVGKLEQRHEELFGVDVKQFSDKLDFVQTVTVRGTAKTSSAGTVKYMVCNDKQCLPPKTVNFSIAMQ